VSALPEGYATVVGDGGRPLSAGQRRRVALARAFLREAPLVLLDEPTADLDPASAEVVAEAIDSLRGRATVLVVAHEPSLAQHADRVVRLDRGRALVGAGEAAW
jgi:ABC-type multidrug transport system fused ATPase/permease subunit